MFKPLIVVAALLSVLTAAAFVDQFFTPLPRGLTASVYDHGTWRPAARDLSNRSVHDAQLDPARVAREAGRDPKSAFHIEWTGLLVVEEEGRHWFKLTADDEATLVIDDQIVVDNTGPPAPDRTRGGSTILKRGACTITVRFVQHGGDLRLRLLWATPSYREDFRPPPLHKAWSDYPSADTIARFRLERQVVTVGWGLWLVCLAGACLARVADARTNVLEALRDAPHGLWVALVCAGILFVCQIEWGLPPFRPWALDEIMPAEVTTAFAQRFSGGWHDIYPPLHYVGLSLVHGPSWLAERLGWLDPDEATLTASRHVASRLLTVILALGTLALVHLCACEAGLRRVGPWAAACVISLPFVYYAKTINLDVPYLFWLVASFVFFLRAMKTLTPRECVGLAITAACAICTKDQAYGFYPGMAFALLFAVARAPVASRAAQIKALGAGLLVFVLVFVLAQNLLFNLLGFRAHLQSITTSAGPETYRMFPATPGGMASLTAVILQLIPWSLGWPVTMAAIAGVVLLRRNSPLLWLAAPALSYLLTFVAVVGYVYDRFLLGVLVVLALWAGVAFDRVAQWRPAGRPVGFAASLLAVGVTLFGYSASVNAAMRRDSRLAAESWLRAHATNDPVVVGIGGQEYLPNLHRWRFRLTSSRAAEVFDWQAEYIVINEPLARRLAARKTEPGALERLEAGESGYARVFRSRTELPRFSLLRYTRWWRSEEDEPFTNLDKIGPTISIWRRVAP